MSMNWLRQGNDPSFLFIDIEEGPAAVGSQVSPRESASGTSLLETSQKDGKGDEDHRCAQRQCASASILLVLMLCGLTYLETFPKGILHPPPLCFGMQDNVIIAPDMTGVVWEGWGTSLAWWANWAGGLPHKNLTSLLDAIFDPVKGLGLTMARYNIGGGGNSSMDASFKTAPKSFRATPGFRDSPQQPYNWSQDLNQRTILFGARSRGVDTIEAVSYSPPAWMTVSSSFEGASAFKEDNVDPSNYLNYANYMVDVVKAYQDLWGVEFASLAPVNEPVEGFWFYPDNQEGCNFSWEAIDKFLPIVRNALTAGNLSTKIAAFDSWATHSAAPLQQLSKETMDTIDYINVHSYQTQNEQSYKSYVSIRKQVASVARAKGKNVRVSEWGPQYQEGDELEVALVLSRTMTMDVNVLGVSAWNYWLAVESGDGMPFWGLIRSTWNYEQPFWFVRRKQYYVMMQFTRWIVPGSLIIRPQSACQAGLVIAYVESKEQLIIIATNEEVKAITLTLVFQRFATKNATSAVEIFRTSENEDHDKVGTIANQLVPGFISRTLLAKSVTTYVVHGVVRMDVPSHVNGL